MRTRKPKTPTGTGSEVDWFKWVERALEESQPYDTASVKVIQTPRGRRFKAKIPPASPAAKAKSDYAGVYVPGQTYNTDEWVVIQAGPGQGAYISTADGNKNDPRTGINWVQFSSLNQWF